MNHETHALGNRRTFHAVAIFLFDSNCNYNDGAMITTPSTEPADEMMELEAQVQAQGHLFYGIWADDPEALAVFDEIEQARDLLPAARIQNWADQVY